MTIESELGTLFGSPHSCLIHEGKCTCPPLKVSGGLKFYKQRIDQMQSSHPKYITSREQIIDPETGSVLYDREVPIPWADAVKYGVVDDPDAPQRSKRASANRSRHPEANTAIHPQNDREV